MPRAPLRLNFRKAPLQMVLNYLHDAAELPIEVEPNVEIERLIDLWSEEPVTRQAALKLLEVALAREGYLAIDRIGILAIVRRQDAKKHAIPLPELTAPEVSG